MNYNDTDYYFGKPKKKKRVIPYSVLAKLSKPTSPNQPTFVCKHCNQRYIMSFSTFGRERTNFSEEAHYCKICARYLQIYKS